MTTPTLPVEQNPTTTTPTPINRPANYRPVRYFSSHAQSLGTNTTVTSTAKPEASNVDVQSTVRSNDVTTNTNVQQTIRSANNGQVPVRTAPNVSATQPRKGCNCGKNRGFLT